MFSVISKNDKKIVREVYGTRENNGKIQFLIFADACWMWMSADLYVPVMR